MLPDRLYEKNINDDIGMPIIIFEDCQVPIRRPFRTCSETDLEIMEIDEAKK